MSMLTANLTSPARVALIKSHRMMRSEVHKTLKHPYVTNVTCEPTIGSSLKKDSDLKPIDLKEIDRTVDRIYQDRVLKLTIIDEPMLGFSSLGLLVEDDEKDVIPMCVYGIPQTPEACETFAYATTLLVVNPYLRIGVMDQKPYIRIDDIKTVIFTGKKVDMCRYCGEENATKKCADCGRHYCNRECQVADWKILKHKLVCKL